MSSKEQSHFSKCGRQNNTHYSHKDGLIPGTCGCVLLHFKAELRFLVSFSQAPRWPVTPAGLAEVEAGGDIRGKETILIEGRYGMMSASSGWGSLPVIILSLQLHFVESSKLPLLGPWAILVSDQVLLIPSSSSVASGTFLFLQLATLLWQEAFRDRSFPTTPGSDHSTIPCGS